MHHTERADRLEQLRAELAVARRSVADYDALSIEAKDMAAEQLTDQGRWAYTGARIRYRGQAMSWEARVRELVAEIAALESGPAAFAAPVSVSAAQCAAVDDTHRFQGVPA